jgi:phosphatidylinositol-3-phosphatase
VSVDPSGRCEDCGSPLDRGQRYCLNCGSRAGSRSPQLVGLLRRWREHPRPVEPASPSIPPPGHTTGTAYSAAGRSGLMLPPPRVSALLVLVFLGFGVILGGAAGSRVDDTLAASARPPLKLILPPAAPVASTSTPLAVSPPVSEPPPAESQSIPAPGSSGSSKPSPKSPSPGSTKKTSSPHSTGGKSGSPESSAGGSKLPPVKHVFLIVLSDQPYASVFGPSSPSPYLSQTLEHRGELLVRYYAVAHEQLANGVALLSGQGPTPQTAQNCPTYEDLTPGTVGAEEQVTGAGCVYPSATQTLAGQLTAKHLTWRAYLEGMDEGASSGADGACGHPALGAADPSAAQAPPAGQTYATWRNPLVYFHSVIDSSQCASDDVGLNQLKPDLASAKRTPSFSYIVPDLCHDGSPTPCASGAPAGLPAAEGFLKQVVGEILGSKAYKESGLLAITVDQAPSSGELADSSSCCDQPQFPNLPASASGLRPEGGGQVGALLLSPFVKPGVSQESYNHFSLLRTIEDLFGLTHLGYAGLPKVSSFEPSMFSAHRSG